MKRWIILLIVAALSPACFTGCAEEGAQKAQTAATTEKVDTIYGDYVCKIGLDTEGLESDVLQEYIKNFGEIDSVLRLNKNMTLEKYLDLDLENYIVAFLKNYAREKEITYSESWNYWVSGYGSEERFRSAMEEQMNGHGGTKENPWFCLTYSISGNTIPCELDGEVLSLSYNANSASLTVDGDNIPFVRR